MAGGNGRAWAGVLVSATISMVLLSSALYLSLNGHEETAQSIYRYAFWPFVAVFAVGSGSQMYERIRKWQLMKG